MSSLRITGGTIYDPANGIDGQVGDIWIVDGRVVETPAEPDASADRTIDATGRVVMPGGIDMIGRIGAASRPRRRGARMCPSRLRSETSFSKHSLVF